MILEIEYRGDRLNVEIAEGTGQIKAFVIGGRPVLCDCVRLPDGRYSIIIDGRVHDMRVDIEQESCVVTNRLGSFSLRVRDPRRLAVQAPSADGWRGMKSIHADMPGKVVRILVNEGDPVEYDQGLVVLEAMKMQNEIRSPVRGTVRRIGVKEGKPVSAGDLLLSLE